MSNAYGKWQVKIQLADPGEYIYVLLRHTAQGQDISDSFGQRDRPIACMIHALLGFIQISAALGKLHLQFKTFPFKKLPDFPVLKYHFSVIKLQINTKETSQSLLQCLNAQNPPKINIKRKQKLNELVYLFASPTDQKKVTHINRLGLFFLINFKWLF